MRFIVFDWDDSLFPTTHLLKYKEDIIFTEVSENIKTLISISKQFGEVYIITNANYDWVRNCINTYLTDCHSILDQVHFISTIDSGIAGYTPIPRRKTVAFQRITGLFTSRSPENHLISFGDSIHDRDACEFLRPKLVDVYIKSIKFMDEPSYEFLLAQQNLIIQKLVDILTLPQSMDVKLHPDQL